jgi:hypothetical protein
MRKIMFNIQTGETEILEVPDTDNPEVEISDPKTDAMDAVNSATTLADLKTAMLNYINIS